MRRRDVVAEARAWVGTPWKHQGCIKGKAADCVGLIKGVGLGIGVRVDGLDVEKYRGYRKIPNPKTMMAGLSEHMRRVAMDQSCPGDVVLIRIDGQPQHLAILSGDDMIVHAYAQARRVVEQRIPAAWRREIVRAYAYPGVV